MKPLSIILFLLAACDRTTSIQPASPIEPSCMFEAIGATPKSPQDACLIDMHVDVVCSPEGQRYNGIAIGWWTPDREHAGIVNTSYQCNTTVSATFTMPCGASVLGSASFQHPIKGGNLYANEGVMCKDKP